MSLTSLDSAATDSAVLNERLLDVLRDAVGRNTSARSLSDKLGHSHNYVRRLLCGEIPLQVSTLLDVLQQLGLPPRNFFDQVFEGQPLTDPIAVLRFYREGDGLPRDPFLDEVGPRIEALAHRPVDPDAAVESRRHELDRLEDERFEDSEGVKLRLEAIIQDILCSSEALPSAVPETYISELAVGCAIWATIQRTTGYRANCCDMYLLAFGFRARQIDSFTRGLLFQKAAYLLGDLGAQKAGFLFLDCAVKNFMAAGSQEKLGQVLVDRGVLLGQLDEHKAAESCFLSALKLLPRSAVRHRASAYGSIARAAQEQGDIERALEFSQAAHLEYGNREDTVAAQMLANQGVFLRTLGQLVDAEVCFKEALRIFEKVGHAGNIALVSLEYGSMLLQASRTEDLRRLADRMFGCLKVFRNDRVVDAALMEFIRTAKWGELTQSIVEQTKRRLTEAAKK